MKMRRYFAAVNAMGFANSWEVLVFDSTEKRDAFIDAVDVGVKCFPITKRTVGYHATNASLTSNRFIAPRPFSGEYWGIMEYGLDDYKEEYRPIGRIEVCDPYSNYERLYA